jgi:hypothetical protein
MRCFEPGADGLELFVVGPRFEDAAEAEVIQSLWSD